LGPLTTEQELLVRMRYTSWRHSNHPDYITAISWRPIQFKSP